MRRIHQLNLFKKSCPLPKAQLQAYPVQTRKKRSAVPIDKREKNETESKCGVRDMQNKKSSYKQVQNCSEKKKNWKGVKNKRI